MAKQWWKPSKVDKMMWYKDLGQHSCGEFSMAVIQANSSLEDQTQIESGPLGTFVGVYDGHGGPEAARFVNSNLFSNVKKFASEVDEISTSVIKKAFSATDSSFLSLVKQQWQEKPQMASVGSCCLVGIISNGVLHVGNAGDSRAVLGRADDRNPRKIKAIQLSDEHNANFESVRDELCSRHPLDPDIVMIKHNVWRVKGIIQVSRSIGDAYLKSAEFNRDPLEPKFRLLRPFSRPILTSEPTVTVHNLQPQDRFLIFASDGLWDHLSSQDAVDIVASYPSRGIARRLIKAALKEAAKKREVRYSDMKEIERGVRRHFHDDITVVVLFLNHHCSAIEVSPLSLKGPV